MQPIRARVGTAHFRFAARSPPKGRVPLASRSPFPAVNFRPALCMAHCAGAVNFPPSAAVARSSNYSAAQCCGRVEEQRRCRRAAATALRSRRDLRVCLPTFYGRWRRPGTCVAAPRPQEHYRSPSEESRALSEGPTRTPRRRQSTVQRSA